MNHEIINATPSITTSETYYCRTDGNSICQDCIFYNKYQRCSAMFETTSSTPVTFQSCKYYIPKRANHDRI